jgi:hypothetical protein
MLIRDKENSWSIDLNGKQFGARLAMGQPSTLVSEQDRPTRSLAEGICGSTLETCIRRTSKLIQVAVLLRASHSRRIKYFRFTSESWIRVRFPHGR